MGFMIHVYITVIPLGDVYEVLVFLILRSILPLPPGFLCLSLLLHDLFFIHIEGVYVYLLINDDLFFFSFGFIDLLNLCPYKNRLLPLIYIPPGGPAEKHVLRTMHHH